MFCPNCGANNSTEQKFCRSCGLNLEKTAESLLEQIPSAQSANLLKSERILEKFGTVAFGGFLTVLLLGVSFLVFYVLNKMVLSGENVLFGILLLAFIIFAVLTLAYVFLKETIKEKKQNTNPAMRRELAETKETGKLLEEKFFEPAASVTENTTKTLYTESKTRKL